jgi:hypothetical protein
MQAAHAPRLILAERVHDQSVSSPTHRARCDDATLCLPPLLYTARGGLLAIAVYGVAEPVKRGAASLLPDFALHGSQSHTHTHTHTSCRLPRPAGKGARRGAPSRPSYVSRSAIAGDAPVTCDHTMHACSAAAHHHLARLVCCAARFG